MDITVRLNEARKVEMLFKELGYEKMVELLGQVCDNFLRGLTPGMITDTLLKDRIRDAIIGVGTGRIKDFYDAYNRHFPEDDISYSTISTYVQRMVEKGEMTKISRGVYFYNWDGINIE